MPVDYEINKQEGVVLTHPTGLVTTHEIRVFRAALKADPAFRSDMRQLVDASGAEGFELTSEEIADLTLTDPFVRDALRTFVAPNDEIFGLARMYELYANLPPESFKVVRSVGEAYAWIKLDPPAAAQA